MRDTVERTEREREREREERKGSVAPPNFNSLITGARATSCQSARIFQTIVFVNPSGGLAASEATVYTRPHEYTHVYIHRFRIYDDSCSLPERERIDYLCRLAFLSYESPSVCQRLYRMSQKAPLDCYSDWVGSDVADRGLEKGMNVGSRREVKSRTKKEDVINVRRSKFPKLNRR